jgi:hypothetical protein
MPCPRRLVVGFSSRRFILNPTALCVGFVLNKVALKQAFLAVLQVSPVSIIPLMFHTFSFLYYQSYVTLVTDSVVKQHTLKNNKTSICLKVENYELNVVFTVHFQMRYVQ